MGKKERINRRIGVEKREELPLAVRPVEDWFWLMPWLFAGFVLMLPVAEWALHADHEITHDRARFHVINAATLTGFQSIKPIGDFPVHAQVVIAALTVIGILFPMVVGGMCVVRILGWEYSDRQIVVSAVTMMGVLIVVGAMGLMADGRSAGNAFFLSASAFGNSGLSIEPRADVAGLAAARDAFPKLVGWQTHLVLLPLAFVGSLGLPVLMELWKLVRGGGSLSFHSRVVLGMSGGLYVIVFAGFGITRWIWYRDVLTWEHAEELAASASVAAINTRTAGFRFEWGQDYPAILQWMLMAPMIIGGAPASTAGGIKVTTVYELFRGARRALRGENPGKSFGMALAWAGLSGAGVLVLFLLIVAAAPELRPDRLMFETISATSNVGLSFYHIQIVTPALDVLSVGMLFGRMAPLCILWWQARRAGRSDLAIG